MNMNYRENFFQNVTHLIIWLYHTKKQEQLKVFFIKNA